MLFSTALLFCFAAQLLRRSEQNQGPALANVVRGPNHTYFRKASSESLEALWDVLLSEKKSVTVPLSGVKKR